MVDQRIQRISHQQAIKASAVEDGLVGRGTPLLATPMSKAAATLRDVGVVRIDGVFDQVYCKQIRARILTLTASTVQTDDLAYVPGTRLRFGDAVQLPMDGSATQHWSRNDVLLPLEDDLVADALQRATQRLRPVLADGAACLPGDAAVGLELVELASLIARVGVGHQMLHADFRRDCDFETIAALGGEPKPAAVPTAVPSTQADDTQADKRTPADGARASNAYGQMPPRLVTFVYLQDVPSAAHGATVFLPGTANDASHEALLGCSGATASEPPPPQLTPGALPAPMTPPKSRPTALLRISDLTSRADSARADSGAPLLPEPTHPPETTTPDSGPAAAIATLRAGDAVIFDASILHFGGSMSQSTADDANRLVLYFGVARAGAAAAYDGGVKIRQATTADERRPVTLAECCSGVGVGGVGVEGVGGGAPRKRRGRDGASEAAATRSAVMKRPRVASSSQPAAPMSTGFGSPASRRSSNKAKKKKR